MPPEETISMPPLTVVLPAVPPERTTRVPPLMTSMPLLDDRRK